MQTNNDSTTAKIIFLIINDIYYLVMFADFFQSI